MDVSNIQKIIKEYEERLKQSKNINSGITITSSNKYGEFKEKYKYGELTEDELKKFVKITTPDKLMTFNQCVLASQTGSKICNPSSDIDGLCPYMAYKDIKDNTGDCYISNEEITNLNGNSGIDMYLTPAKGDQDIKTRAKMAVDKLINKMNNEKENLDKQLNETKLYLKSLDENIPIDDLKKNEEKEVVNNVIKKRNKIEKVINNDEKILEELLYEKNQRLENNNNTIKNNDENLTELDKKILTLRQLISSNDYKYYINSKVSKILMYVIFIIIFTGVCAFLFKNMTNIYT